MEGMTKYVGKYFIQTINQSQTCSLLPSAANLQLFHWPKAVSPPCCLWGTTGPCCKQYTFATGLQWNRLCKCKRLYFLHLISPRSSMVHRCDRLTTHTHFVATDQFRPPQKSFWKLSKCIQMSHLLLLIFVGFPKPRPNNCVVLLAEHGVHSVCATRS